MTWEVLGELVSVSDGDGDGGEEGKGEGVEGDALVSTWQPFGLSDFVSRQMPDETYMQHVMDMMRTSF